MAIHLIIPNEFRAENGNVYLLNTKDNIEPKVKVQHIFDVSDVDYQCLDVYPKRVANKTEVHVQYYCSTCGNTNTQRFSDLTKGHGCKKCGYATIKKRSRTNNVIGKFSTLEQVQTVVDSIYGTDVFSVLSKFRGDDNTTYVKIKCCFCDKEIIKQWSNVKRKQQCKCQTTKQYDVALKELQAANVTGLDVFDENTKKSYRGTQYPVKIYCTLCSTYYTLRYAAYTTCGQRCGHCSFSKNELFVKQYLQQHNINYQTQQTFINCKHVSKLRFDFYIPKLNLIIETHGIQHYQLIPHWHQTQEEFDLQQLRDSIKRQFIKDNGFNYLEIDCREFNSQTKIFNLLHSYIFSLENLLKLNQCVIL